MRLLQINSYNYLSTGKIMMDISELAQKSGMESYTACPAARTMYAHKKDNQMFIGTILGRSIHRWFSEASGYHGVGSFIDSILFLRKVKSIRPDIIHLHNIHGSYINIPLLFRFLKKNPDIKVFWTFHDCWPFTGGCPHFEIHKCYKWKSQCRNCPYEGYPKGKRDKTLQMFNLKKEMFLGLSNLDIVCPSKWLSNLVRESFLSGYHVSVINNGIDLNVFKPVESDIRRRLGLGNKVIILGVASTWSYRKGLDIFKELAKNAPENYAIVMIGTTEEIIKGLPSSILPIKRTNNVSELVELYSTSDVFFNPTREDTFPTVNIEALACGTPVVTFTSGGSREIIDDSCGRVASEDNYLDVIQELVEQNISSETCRKRSKVFDKDSKLMRYIELYHMAMR